MEPCLLEQEHQHHLKAAMQLFDTTRKIGGRENSQKYRAQLEMDINKRFSSIARRNGQAWQVKGFNSPNNL